MTGNQYTAVVAFESGLKEGDSVEVCWTNCHRYYHATGTVARVNAKSIRVALATDVPTGMGSPYPAGREIVVPLIGDFRRWSPSNRVQPVGNYPTID